jgi:exopolysaccharide production protein ExoQ
MTKLLRGNVKILFATLALFYSTSPLFLLLKSMHGETIDPLQGDYGQQAIWFLIYVISLLFLYVERKELKPLLKAKVMVLLLLLGMLVSFSIFWSAYPEVAFRKAGAFWGTMFFGLFLGALLPKKDFMQVLTWVFFGGVWLSLFVVLLMPSWGIHQDLHAGSWRGAFIHKNTLGNLMVVALTIGVLNMREGLRSKLNVLLIAGAAVLLFFSQSRTALITAMFLFVLFIVIVNWTRLAALSKWHKTLLFPVLVPGAWLIINYEKVLLLLGRDATLTGRTDLWVNLFLFAREKLFLGYGYGTFWMGSRLPSGLLYERISWTPTQAHNGYLEVVLHLGLAGLLVAMTIIFFGMLKASQLAFSGKPHSSLFMMYSSYFLIFNIVESALLLQNNFFWILYLAVTIRMWSYKERDASG